MSEGAEEKHTKIDQDRQYGDLESNLRPDEILREKHKRRKSSTYGYRSMKLNVLQFGHDVPHITASSACL
jgi:hypothetical protein